MPFEVQTLAEWEASGVPEMLSVVIPTHNEEGHIRDTILSIVASLTAAEILHEIVVVNDNSNDQTSAIVLDIVRTHPTVRMLNNAPPNGYGFAVRRGLAGFRGEIVAIMMADGSDDPGDLVAYYRKLMEGYDCIFGSRFVKGGKTVGYPIIKLLLNRLGNTFIRLLFGLKNNDISNAFKMFRRSVIAGVQPLLSHHFNLTVEIPLKAVVRGFSYATVPNRWYNRKEGTSKFEVREMGSRYFFIIFYCWLERALSRNDYANQSELRANQLQVWPR